MLRELLQEMFTAMVEAKDITQAPVYYDPGFRLYTNGQVQDYEAFHAGHARVYPTAISYRVEYDDEAWPRRRTGWRAGCGSPPNARARTRPGSK